MRPPTSASSESPPLVLSPSRERPLRYTGAIAFDGTRSSRSGHRDDRFRFFDFCRLVPGDRVGRGTRRLLTPSPPRNRTCQSPGIRLEQALEVRWREAVRSSHRRVDRPRVRSPRPWSWRLTCPSVRASSSSSPAGLTGPRLRSFEPGHEDPYPAGYPRRQAGGLALLPWFPVAFRPPAFASRPSCSRRGVPPSSRSAYRPQTP